MTKAIFKIYDNGKFIIGAWVKSDGGVRPNSIFPYVMETTNILQDRNLKKSFYDSINEYLNEYKFRTMFGDKKNPFVFQVDSNGTTPVEVLFWEQNLTDKKLVKENVWGEYIYEIRFTKKQLKVKVDYAGNTREWVSRNPDKHDDFVETMLTEVAAWVDNIDFGLNDCDCGKEEMKL